MRVSDCVNDWLNPDPPRTKQYIADALSITRPTLDRKIAGESEWTVTEVARIASLTGCSLEELVSDYKEQQW